MDQSDEDEFRHWAQLRRPALRRTAYLLCADWHAADDLVQDTFTKMYLAWWRVGSLTSVDAYARRVLVNAFADTGRRPWRREMPAVDIVERADSASAPDESGSERHEQLVEALRSVPLPQRTVLVLRFWEDLSVEQTAQLLGRSVGTVKSQTSRGLAALRTRLGPSFATEEVHVP